MGGTFPHFCRRIKIWGHVPLLPLTLGAHDLYTRWYVSGGCFCSHLCIFKITEYTLQAQYLYVLYSRGVNRAGPNAGRAGPGRLFQNPGSGRSFANLARIRADPGRNKSIKCVAKEGTKVEI